MNNAAEKDGLLEVPLNVLLRHCSLVVRALETSGGHLCLARSLNQYTLVIIMLLVIISYIYIYKLMHNKTCRIYYSRSYFPLGLAYM